MEPTLNALPAIRAIFYNQYLRQRHALILVLMDIGGTLQTTFAYPVILLAQFAWVEHTLNAHLAKWGIFCNRRQRFVLTIAPQQDIGKTLQTTFVRLAVLLVRFVQVQIIINAPLVIQNIFCSLCQQYALILVQKGIGETLQTTFAHPVILLAQFARMEHTLNAHLATWGISCSRHQQYALTLVQTGIGKTLQLTVVLLAILLVLFVQVQVILNALPAIRAIFCSQYLRQRHALILVQRDFGETLQTKFAHSVILLAQFAWMELILNVHLAKRGIFCNSAQRLVSPLAQMEPGLIVQATFA